MEEEKKEMEPKPRKKQEEVPAAAAVPEPDREPGITVIQFVRSEDLGLFKQGFVNHVSEDGLGGRRPRWEWKKLYGDYMKAPRKISC